MRDEATDKYRLGYRLWELSANLSKEGDPGIILLPEMERLRDQLGETISLYVQDGLVRVRIQAVQSNHAIRRVAPVGARMPLYVGASSKVLVAFAEPGLLEQLLTSADWPTGLRSRRRTCSSSATPDARASPRASKSASPARRQCPRRFSTAAAD